MDKDLEAKIKERKKLAGDKKIVIKADSVAKYVGSLTNSWTGHLNSEKVTETIEIYTFSDKNLKIVSEGGLTKIAYKGQDVFKERYTEVEKYIPGAWERKLDDLYKKAEEICEKRTEEEEQKRNKKKAEKEAEEREKWGF